MKLLLEHLKNNREALLKYSDVISVAKHSVNLGTARESLISNFLKQNLPEYISYHTGEIFDREDARSGQIDIVLHPITAPKINLHNAINIFPSETVLAAIEIKSNLTTGTKTGSLSEALSSCKRVKELKISGESRNDSVVVDHTRVPFIIFAFKGPTIDTLTKHINQSSNNIRELPDLIVVLDRGYYITKNAGWHHVHEQKIAAFNVNDDKSAVLLGIYEYILNIVEYWFVNPEKHTMPIENYTKDMPSLFRFFK